MTKDLVSHHISPYTILTSNKSKQTFDIRYDNELAYDYYGDGKKLADKYSTYSYILPLPVLIVCSLRDVYHDKNLTFPNDFESTTTIPPIHFMGYASPHSYLIKSRLMLILMILMVGSPRQMTWI